MVSFYFSPEQKKTQDNSYKMTGKPNVLAFVLSDGDWKEYTEMTHSPSGKPFIELADHVLLFQGEKARVKYGVDGTPYDIR